MCVIQATDDKQLHAYDSDFDFFSLTVAGHTSKLCVIFFFFFSMAATLRVQSVR